MFSRANGRMASAQNRVERCGVIDQDEAGISALRAEMIARQARLVLSAVFKALCDPTRLRLISLLVRQEFCVGDLAAALDGEPVGRVTPVARHASDGLGAQPPGGPARILRIRR